MAYRDSHIERLKKLVKNPQKEMGHVWPFIKSKLTPYHRTALEFFGNYTHSKPFEGHDNFLPHVNFKNGFFVQCGGMNGYGNDPTYYLEKALGWKGIIVEPLPVYIDCKKNRSKSVVYNYAAGSFDDRDAITSFIDCYGMSFVKGSIDNEKEWIDTGEWTQKIQAKEIQVKMKPVQDFIDEYFVENPHREIDLFVADVEGYELNVLKGLDFDKNKPKQILLEISKQNVSKLVDFLSPKGYVLSAQFTNDYLFKLK